MNTKLLFVVLLFVVLMLDNSDASQYRSRRRQCRRSCPPPPKTTPKPTPPCKPKGSSCSKILAKYTKVDGNKLHLLAKVWAPSVRLAKGEKYNPSSVKFFLKYVKFENCKCVKPGDHFKPTPRNLPTCEADCYLTAIKSLGKPESPKPTFLRGQNPSKVSVPVYVFISEDNATNVVEFDYKFFFPYNIGKKICVRIKRLNLKKCVVLGNHVGDWENVKIRFEKGRLHSMYLSAHDSKVTKKYLGTFLWNDEEYFAKGDKIVKLDRCTHGIVYSSKGSHGFWHKPGKHVYKKIIAGYKLYDSCSTGLKWKTWKNLKITWKKSEEDRSKYSGEFSFVRFIGRWGNKKKGCIKIFNYDPKICVLNQGPKLNFN